MATDPALTPNGYENQFGVNHLGHALLVKLLLPLLQKSSETPNGNARILFLTSTGFMYPFPSGIQFSALKTTQDFGPGSQWARYGQSKLANVQYAAELARRYPSILSVSLHPGAVKTDLIERLKPEEKDLVYRMNEVVVEPEEGVWNTCWCVTGGRGEVRNGEVYFLVGMVGEHTKELQDGEMCARFWDWTQEELGGNGL